MTSRENDCYTEGYEWCIQGGMVVDCWHQVGSQEEIWWVSGFWDAAQGKRNKFDL